MNDDNDDDSIFLFPELPPAIDELIESANNKSLEGKYEEGLALLNTIPDDYKLYPQALSETWVALYGMMRYADALEVAILLCEKQPKNFWVWLYKGDTLAQLNRFEEALAVFIEGFKQSDMEIMRVKIAGCKNKLGKRDEALALLRQIFEADEKRKGGGHMRRHALNEPMLADIKHLIELPI